MPALPRHLSLFVARSRRLIARLSALCAASAAVTGLSVARKLKASLAVCGAGLVAVAVVYAWTGHNNERAAATFAANQQQAALAANLATQVTEARRLQTLYAQRFADEDRQALQQAQQELQSTLTQLQRTPSDARSTEALAAVAGRAQEFAEGIAALNTRVEEMGRGDEALVMQLERAAVALNSAVEASQQSLLAVQLQKMRRQEALLLLTGDSSHTDKASEERLPFELTLSASRLPGAQQDVLRGRMDDYQGALLAYTAARVGLDVEAQSLADTAAQLTPALHRLQQSQATLLEAARVRQQAEARAMTVMFALTLGMVALVLIATLVLVLRAVRQPIADTLRFAEDVAEDRLDSVLTVHNPHDEIGQLAQRLIHMQQRLRQRIEAERAAARENARARQALDSAQTGLMVLDTDGQIGFLNRALLAELSLSGSEWQGRAASALHPVFGALAQQQTPAESHEIEHAGTRYQLVINPIRAEGQLLGAAVEWRSRALETTVETEVAALVDAAAQGQLHGRIAVADKQGFVLTLAVSINRLLDTFQGNLAGLQQVLSAVSQGDLTVRMQGDFHGVFAQMRDDANASVIQLTDIVSRIQQAERAISGATAEIAAGHADLSQRTERQAASLDGTASAMEALTASVHDNANAAQQANRLSQNAAAVAAEGGVAVAEVVSSMREIAASSRRIGEITAVIDGIAFQTNILALNAAVEAARAGEQGRSFAVVASEVRLLAQRSADAARQIKQLIESSVQSVDVGARQVDAAGATMAEIVASIERVTAIMAGISSASQQQSIGIAQLNQTVLQMDQATLQNASLVEQASAAAAAMQDQGQMLSTAVAAFRLQPGQLGARPARAALALS